MKKYQLHHLLKIFLVLNNINFKKIINYLLSFMLKYLINIM